MSEHSPTLKTQIIVALAWLPGIALLGSLVSLFSGNKRDYASTIKLVSYGAIIPLAFLLFGKAITRLLSTLQVAQGMQATVLTVINAINLLYSIWVFGNAAAVANEVDTNKGMLAVIGALAVLLFGAALLVLQMIAAY